MPKMFEYVQQLKHLKVNIEDIRDILEAHESVKKFVYAIHDKDDDTEPHIHVMGNCGNTNVPFKDVANWFNDDVQRVEYIKCKKWDRAVLYLMHGGEKDISAGKHLYDVNELHGNYDFTADLQKAKTYEENHKGKMTLEQFCRKVVVGELPFYNPEEYLDDWDILNDKGLIKKAYAERVRRLINERKGGKMNVKVLFIYGAAGEGKDVFAQTFAQSVGDGSFYISSTKNDTMQDYAGENTLILSDLRDNTFEFDTLLKVLDNHVPASIQSRYNNKYFIGNYLIITSAVDLFDWYANTKEDRNQLFRRIGTYIKIDKTAGTVSQYNIIPYTEAKKYDDDKIIKPFRPNYLNSAGEYQCNYVYKLTDVSPYAIIQNIIDLRIAEQNKDAESALKIVGSSLEFLTGKVNEISVKAN